ncbi:MAG: transposase [Ruminiclostridium sp.]|nr:transposase [Ruminiclostridium sp.]
MNPSEISQILHSLKINLDEISDKKESQTIRILLHIIEELNEEVQALKAELQKTRDELNNLKGEQGKPKFPVPKQNKDVSSENERRNPTSRDERKSKEKLSKIKIDVIEDCKVDPSVLPGDAEFKYYDTVVVQDIIITTKNTAYRKEVWYSPSQHRTYRGELPHGIEGEFGNGVKSLIITLKHASNVSEPKIHEFLENIGIFISPATISRILTKNLETFHQEKADIFEAGLKSTRYQQIDDTGAKVNGQNQYVEILCNPFYTAYFTIPAKDRLSILDILQGSKPRSYYFNEEAFTLLESFGLPKIIISKMRDNALDKVLDEKQMQHLIDGIFHNPDKGKNIRTRIMEAGAIAAYHNRKDFPVVKVLLSDDARQFKKLTEEQALCWIHDGRNYKKLEPIVPLHKKELEDYLSLYWNYYRKLLQFKEKPTQENAEQLSADFDILVSTKTNYGALNERIEKTKENKSELLLTLKYPEIPLHNNAAELGARSQVRKRDVSLHTMTKDGTRASDTFMTIVHTAKKLGVSVFDYISDRVSKSFKMPSLAEMIKAKKSLGFVCQD